MCNHYFTNLNDNLINSRYSKGEKTDRKKETGKKRNKKKETGSSVLIFFSNWGRLFKAGLA